MDTNEPKMLSQQMQHQDLVEANIQSKDHLLQLLQHHPLESLRCKIDNVIDTIAELRSCSRTSLLEATVSSWFAEATKRTILEVECHEQKRTDEDWGGLLLFRIRLDSDYDCEVANLSQGEDLAKKYRNLLVEALPSDLVEKKGSKLNQMIQVSWTKKGSVELGGVAALSLVTLIIIAIGLAACPCKACSCNPICTCLNRSRHAEAAEYSCALRELRQRGAEFEVNPDGSATLKVPPIRTVRFRCPDCFLL